MNSVKVVYNKARTPSGTRIVELLSLLLGGQKLVLLLTVTPVPVVLPQDE